MFNTTVSFKDAEGKRVSMKGQKWEMFETVREEAERLVKNLKEHGCTEIEIKYFNDFGEMNQNDADLFEVFPENEEEAIIEENCMTDEEFDEFMKLDEDEEEYW